MRTSASTKISISHLRRYLLIILTLAVLGFTVAVFVLVQRIFDNFGPGVASDLERKTLRGAQALAITADLGLAVHDAEVVERTFADYRHDEDVVAIAAESTDGVLVASHGIIPKLEGGLFQSAPATVRRAGALLITWAPAVIEGSPVGRVALVVSTKRLVDSRKLLRRLSVGTLISGLIAWLSGVGFVLFFTRGIAARDARLAEYANSLEEKVRERTAELGRINQGMRLVLDNVDQGFITIDLEGVMSPERSRICDHWFGSPAPEQTLITAIGLRDPAAAECLSLGLAQLRDGILPLDLLLDQLPPRLRAGERTLRLSYQPIGRATPALPPPGQADRAPAAPPPTDDPERLLVVLTDITEELARERVERDSREMVRIFQRISSDRQGFVQFMDEVGAVVEGLASANQSAEAERRAVHTIKGNTGLYGLESMATLCHDLETKLRDEDRSMSADERRGVVAAWEHIRTLVRPLLGDRRPVVEVEEEDYRLLLSSLRAGATTDELLGIVLSWGREPISVRFQRLADQAQLLAKRLGKPAPAIHSRTRGLRLDPRRWIGFWTAAVHALNNAVDHGIEAAEVRRAAGKPESGQIWLEAAEAEDGLTLTLRDDGAGVDWDAVAARAAAKGLPHDSPRDLVEALFADGLSTRDEASLTSGRGTGMGALRASVRELGGAVEVTSTRGQGTVLTVRFPREKQPRLDQAA